MGAREQFTNNAQSTLNGAINSSVTSVVVVDGSSFPSGGFRIIIEDEILYCLTRSSNTLTVVRGAENTTPASHADTLDVRHVLTAGALDGFRLNMLHDIGMVPQVTSLSTDDDEFDDSSFGGWTTVQGSPNATITEHTHMAHVSIPSGSSGGQQYAFMKAKTPSAGDWVQCGIRIVGNGGQYPLPGCMIANGNTYGAGKQVGWGWSPHEGVLWMRDFDNYVSQNSGTGRGGISGQYFMSALHLRLKWNSSNNYTGYVSHDGIEWLPSVVNQSAGSVGTPTHMGFSATSWGAAFPLINSFMYCRFSF